MHWHEAGEEDTNLLRGDESRVVVESRRHVIARLRAAVLSSTSGPLLVTGEPGSGKTWVSRCVISGLPGGWRSARVALTGSLDALDFLTLAGHDLGLARCDRLSTARLCLQAALRDEHADGRNWLLVVNDAHRSVPEVWDEIQVLVDQLRTAGGFAALVVLSDTPLIRMAATRPLRSFAVSLNEHHHLPPLDLDEARVLLGFSANTSERESLILEDVHRDAAGNPRRLLRLASSRLEAVHGRTPAIEAAMQPLSPTGPSAANGDSVSAARRDRRVIEFSDHAPTPVDSQQRRGHPSDIAPEPPIRIEKPAAALSAVQAPALLPSKPPIRIEEGLVEVGWEGDLEAEYAGSDEPAIANPESPAPARPVVAVQETVVDDHYAALQAWTEQSQNRQRARSEGSLPGDALEPVADEAPDSEGPSSLENPDESELRQSPTPAKIRAEGQHEFAPYSQLFTRLRQSS